MAYHSEAQSGQQNDSPFGQQNNGLLEKCGHFIIHLLIYVYFINHLLHAMPFQTCDVFGCIGDIGKSNDFLIKYKNVSCLEQHHAGKFYEALCGHTHANWIEDFDDATLQNRMDTVEFAIIGTPRIWNCIKNIQKNI